MNPAPVDRRPQSPLQRRYYWALVTHAARVSLPAGTPFEAQKYLHNEFKGLILGYEEVIGSNGKPTLEPFSTTDLDHDEMSQYIQAVLAILVDAGVPLPDRAEDLLQVCPRDLGENLPVTPHRKRKVALQ